MSMPYMARMILLAALLPLACDGSGTAPLGVVSSAQSVHGLELSLRVEPADMASGGNFTATFTVTNRRDTAATLISGCTQLARAFVYRAADEEPAWFIGATGGCYQALSTYRLDVGESFQQVWHATAARQDVLDETPWETIPASEGEYVFRVTPDVITIDQESARLPELEAALRVQ